MQKRSTLWGVKGSVWERGDGRFAAAYPVPGGTKRKTTTKRNEDEGWALVAEMERIYGGDEPTVYGAQSVGQYLDEWLRDAVEPSVSRSTFAKRACAVKTHIKPSVGTERLRDLNARFIQLLYAKMAREGYAYSTRREIHVTLKMALAQAFKWSLVRRNECDVADAPRDVFRSAEAGEKVRHLTDEQARLFFASTSEHRWHNYYVAAIRTNRPVRVERGSGRGGQGDDAAGARLAVVATR